MLEKAFVGTHTKILLSFQCKRRTLLFAKNGWNEKLACKRNPHLYDTEKNEIAARKQKSFGDREEENTTQKCAYCSAISLVYTHTTRNIHHAC